MKNSDSITDDDLIKILVVNLRGKTHTNGDYAVWIQPSNLMGVEDHKIRVTKQEDPVAWKIELVSPKTQEIESKANALSKELSSVLTTLTESQVRNLAQKILDGSLEL